MNIAGAARDRRAGSTRTREGRILRTSSSRQSNMPFPREFHGPELLRVVNHAIEDACAEVRAGGGDDGRIPRLMMSVRITAAIAAGERDPARLKLLALKAVGATAPPDDRAS